MSASTSKPAGLDAAALLLSLGAEIKDTFALCNH